MQSEEFEQHEPVSRCKTGHSDSCVRTSIRSLEGTPRRCFATERDRHGTLKRNASHGFNAVPTQSTHANSPDS